MPKIDCKVSRGFDLYEAVLEPDDQEEIQTFLTGFAEHFKINWNRENTLTISTKNKKGTFYIQFKFKSKHIAQVPANQLQLFPGESEEENVHELEEQEA